MNGREKFIPLPEDEFLMLVLRHQENGLSAEEFRQLNEELRANPQRLSEFAQVQDTSRLLCETQNASISASFQAGKISPVLAGANAVDAPVRRNPSRVLLPVAACMAGLIGLAIWAFVSGKGGGGSHSAKAPTGGLDSRWKLVAGAGADYSIVNPNLVRLRSGELQFASVQPAHLVVETPNAVATAGGTRFFIGHHSEPYNNQTDTKPEQTMKKTKRMREMTRVLVLAGMVTMTTGAGSVQAAENEAAVAGAEGAPVKIAVEANSDFAFDLYAQLAEENAGENLFFSPYSVSSALAMTAEGARGETADEMGRVLGFPEALRRVGDDAQMIPWETGKLHAGLSTLNRLFNGEEDPGAVAKTKAEIDALEKQLDQLKAKTEDARKNRAWAKMQESRAEQNKLVAQINTLRGGIDQYELKVANALWAEETYPFKEDYIAKISKLYKTGGMFPVDFIGNFEKVRLQINSWVEGMTNERIKDLIPDGAIDDLTRLVLVNAIYFKGDWSVPFEEKKTKELDFTLAGGEKVKRPIMHAANLEAASYAAFNADGSPFETPARTSRGTKAKTYPGKDGFAMLELPYKGDELSMVVVAPNDPGKLSAIEAKLSSENVTGWIGSLEKRKVHVYLPKFKMETDYTLGDAENPGTLQKMGMVRAFVDPRRPDGAVFDGMSHAKSPQDKLYISKVLHKAFVEVNEKGTEAAAATAVIMRQFLSSQSASPFIPTFKADRPFIYLIRDRETGTVLFVGRVMNPAVE